MHVKTLLQYSVPLADPFSRVVRVPSMIAGKTPFVITTISTNPTDSITSYDRALIDTVTSKQQGDSDMYTNSVFIIIKLLVRKQ